MIFNGTSMNISEYKSADFTHIFHFKIDVVIVSRKILY